MEANQSFRLAGTTDTVVIPCDHIDGQHIIFWEDIEQAFPGVQIVKSGNAVVKMLRNRNRNRWAEGCQRYMRYMRWKGDHPEQVR
jgi:hypothetical protein